MPVLNDLKDDEVTGPIMGRVTWWLISMILLMPIVNAGQSHVYETVEGNAWFDCENSWANITFEDGNLVGNGTDFTVAISNGNHTVSVADPTKCQYTIPVNGELPNQRPAPSVPFDAQSTVVCSQSEYILASCESTLVSGNVSDGDGDIFAIEVLSGQIISLTLNAATSALDIDAHFQNGVSEVKLDNGLSIALNTTIGETNQLLIPVTDDGRIIISVTSPNQGTLWMASVEIFNTGEQETLTNLGNLSGLGSVSYGFGLSEDESIFISSSDDITNNEYLDVKYRYEFTQNNFSDWSSAPANNRIVGINSIVGVELWWDCDCEWTSEISHQTHFDASWGRDAPGFKPLSATSDNTSYPLIPMDGTTFDAELTLFMDDYQDVLRVETTGWNESVHLIDVIVEGDVYELQVLILNMDQNTWDVLDQVAATYSMDKIRITSDVGVGTHFIIVQHINGSSALDENAESLNWKIRISTAVLEEGEEPWFPASNAVKEAADVFYWLIGLLLILPFIIFYISVNRNKKFAAEFARKKNRLQWLSVKLDKGEFSPSDLSRALRSVSTLEWEEALEVWGIPETRHFTNGIDMAVWTLDERISDSDSWPILIGITPQEFEWSIAALKFEANEGTDWVVSSVEPKLLYRSNEVFLDTIYTNARVFIRVDLTGNAKSLDVYLSGMVNGEPIAAKPANTIYRNSAESEE